MWWRRPGHGLFQITCWFHRARHVCATVLIHTAERPTFPEVFQQQSVLPAWSCLLAQIDSLSLLFVLLPWISGRQSYIISLLSLLFWKLTLFALSVSDFLPLDLLCAQQNAALPRGIKSLFDHQVLTALPVFPEPGAWRSKCAMWLFRSGLIKPGL